MALLLAILFALPAFAEESEDGIVALGDDSPADMIEVSDGVPDLAIEPMVGEEGELPSLDLSDALSGDLLAEDVPQSAPETVVTYCFMADDAPVATQEAREGTRSSVLPIPPRRRGMPLSAGSWRMARRCLRTRTATARSTRSSPTRTRCAPRSS